MPRSPKAPLPFDRVFAAASVLLCLTALPVSANPFTGGGPGAPTPNPVRAAPAPAGIAGVQADLHERLGDLMLSWSERAGPGAVWGVLAAAFLYGIFHALGPGHRKTVVFSLYLARKAPVWEPAGTGFLLSLLHGGASVTLLFALRGASGALSAGSSRIAAWMEGIAYALLVLAALVLALGSLKNLLRGEHRHGGSGANLGTILLTGAYPCPGAVLVLVLSLQLGSLGVGVAAVLAMSAGMSLPIVAAGYLAWFGRTGLFLALKRREELLGRVSSGVELAGYLLLLGFSIYIALPFFLSVGRMALG